jgi:TolB-like protein/DNA-binding SARP family transcriptional activator/Tfp pilus assembly protein PilF
MEFSGAVRLTTLGALDLRGLNGRVVQPVLAQPKRVAVLIYLALARPRGMHQRDSLLALFWPERDQQSARKALRQALYFLRAALGEAAIITIGDGEVGVSEQVWCDVVAMEHALEEGRLEAALAFYRGDLLPGFHIDGSPEFAEWLDGERQRLRALLARTALRLARDQSASRAIAAAVQSARRAAELAQGDETIVRDVIKLLHEAGELSTAVRVYDDFASLLSRSYELEPSSETRALADSVRRAAGTRDRVTARSVQAAPEAVARDLVEAPPADAARMVERAAPRKGRLVRRAPWIAAGVAGLLILGGLMRGFIQARSGAGASASIAVLPFTNRSGNEHDLFFTEAVRDEVLTQLYKVGSLRVKGRATMEQYRGSPRSPTEIGRELAATHVLSGGVLRVGPRVRISVQLTETRSGDQVWADSYDRELSVEHLLDVQSEIALRVAAQLTGTLSPAERASIRVLRRPTLQAYEDYLRGRHALDYWGRSEDLENALLHFARSLRGDSTYAPAWAGTSHALRQYARAHERPSPIAWREARTVAALASPIVDPSTAPLDALRSEVKRLMVVAAERAVALDSTLAYGFTALAGIRFEFLFDNEGAERAYRQAVALQPNDPEHHAEYGGFLAAIGRHQEAQEHALRALSDEPFSVNTRALMAQLRFSRGDRAGALRDYAKLIEDYPTRTTPLWYMALRQGTAGLYDEAVVTLRRVMGLMGDNIADETALVGYLHGRARRPDSARAALRRLDELEARGVYVSPLIRSWPYIGLGERDSAYRWLTRAVQEHEPWLAYERVLPAFDPLRGDRRYVALLRSLRPETGAGLSRR